MNSTEIRKRFIAFFEKHGHAVLPSASLVTTDDATATNATLFNTAGMQPLVPYLLGEAHVKGNRLVNIQKCVRTVDLDEVGDNTHLTFFEMMGNWSLGDYFKKDAITWSFQFLTDKEEGLGLPLERLYFTVFGGSDVVEKDTESLEIWKSLGVPEHRIYFKSSKSNWWSAGPNSPAGPSTEMFYDVTGTLGDMSQEAFEKNEDEQKVVEIWNDVFMSYKQEDGKVAGELPQKNVDTGAGLERITAVLAGKQTAYDTDLFAEIMGKIDEFTTSADIRARRIVADHMRTSVFLMADGVVPAPTDRGYILRRIIRRAVRYADILGMKHGALYHIAHTVIEKYGGIYTNLKEQADAIKNGIEHEESKFRETLTNGMKEFEKGTDAFTLFTTYGFPIELTEELAKEKGITIDRTTFDAQMVEHQKLSRTSSAGMFKGGLANHEPATIKLHTAHHLVLAALQNVLGKDVKQRGSNITEERLRIDFSFDRKMTDEEKKQVEDMVNDWIKHDLKVVKKEMPKSEAEALGAEMEFGAKYADVVSVYFIEDENGKHISKEFCGGPHVEHTGELGHFTLQKEEASSAGVRRIKGILK
jgi:alanyl-tRNA synthetase